MTSWMDEEAGKVRTVVLSKKGWRWYCFYALAIAGFTWYHQTRLARFTFKGDDWLYYLEVLLYATIAFYAILYALRQTTGVPAFLWCFATVLVAPPAGFFSSVVLGALTGEHFSEFALFTFSYLLVLAGMLHLLGRLQQPVKRSPQPLESARQRGRDQRLRGDGSAE